MSHTYTANIVHCVFSTKQRAPMIAADRQEHLWASEIGDSLRGEIRARLMSPRWGSMLRVRFPSAYTLG
jgi:hypothetical protein